MYADSAYDTQQIDTISRFFPDFSTFAHFHPEMAIRCIELNIHKELIFRSHPNANTRTKWDYDSVVELAQKFASAKAFREHNVKVYAKARDMGILESLFHEYERDSPRRKWNIHTLTLEAKKYKTREDFKRGSSGAHFSAKEQGVMDYVCQHMPNNACLRWTHESIRETAELFDNKTEFRKAFPHGYRKAKKLGILETLF